MKQKTITLPHCELLVVEMPEGAINPVISMGYLIFREPNYKNWMTEEDMMNPVKMIEWEETHDPKDDYKDAKPIKIVDGDFRLLSRLPDITEEQAAGVVVYHPEQKGDTKRYVTSTKALHSILTTNGVVFENPLGKERPKLKLDSSDYNEFGFVNGNGVKKGADWQQMYWDWLEARKQVWYRERTYLFIKQN